VKSGIRGGWHVVGGWKRKERQRFWRMRGWVDVIGDEGQEKGVSEGVLN
jgi:hypothetical protein